MKKLLSLVLVLAMLFTMAVPVMASYKDSDYPLNITVFVTEDKLAEVANLADEGFDYIYQAGTQYLNGDVFGLDFIIHSADELAYFENNGYNYEVTGTNPPNVAKRMPKTAVATSSENKAIHYKVDPADGYIIGLTGGNTFPLQPAPLRTDPNEIMFDPTGVSFNEVYGFPNRKGYRSVEEYYGEMFYLAETYPNIVKLHLLGSSWYSPIYGLEICNAPGVEDGRAEWLDLAAQHAREWPANELVMNTAWWLVTQYDKYLKGDTTVEPGIVEIMEGMRTWCLPQYNPDGDWYDQSNGVSAAGNNRSNRRPGPEYVTSYNEVLKPYAYGADGVDTGRFYNRTNTAGSANYPVDLNRNFAYRWGSGDGSANPSPGQGGSTTRGPAPLSEPENQALASLVARRMIGSDYSGHTFGGLVIYPWDNKKSLAVTEAMNFEDLGRELWSYNQYNDYHERVIYSQSGEGQGFMFGSWRSLGFTYEMGYNYAASQISFVPPYWGDTTGHWHVAVANYNNLNPNITTKYTQPGGELVAPAGTQVIPLHYKTATAPGNGRISAEVAAPVVVMMPKCVTNQYNINNCRKDSRGNTIPEGAECEYHNTIPTTYTTTDLLATTDRLNEMLTADPNYVKDKILLCYSGATANNNRDIALIAQAAGAKAVLFAQIANDNNGNSSHGMADGDLRWTNDVNVTIPVALMPRPFARDVHEHVKDFNAAGKDVVLTLKPDSVPWNTQMMEWERNAYSFLALSKFAKNYNGQINGTVTDGNGKKVDGARLDLNLTVYAPILKPETANNANGRDIFWWNQDDLTEDQKARFGNMLSVYENPITGDKINVRTFEHTSYIDQFDADGKFNWKVVPSTQFDTYMYEGLRQPAMSSNSTNALRGTANGAGFECATPDDPRIGTLLFPNDGYTVRANAPGYYVDQKQVVVEDYKVVVNDVNFEIPVAITSDFAFDPAQDINKDITATFKAFNKDGTPYTGKANAMVNNYFVSVAGNETTTNSFATFASSEEGVYTLTFNLSAMGIGSVDNAILILSLDGTDEMSPLVIGNGLTAVNPDNLILKSDKYFIKAGEYFNLTPAFENEVETNAAIVTYNYDPSIFEFNGFTPASGINVLDKTVTDGQVKLTLGKMSGYGITEFGSMMLRAKEDTTYTGTKTFTVNAQYVLNSVPKTIANGTALTTVRINSEPVPGDFTLIDLSNLIDMYGKDNTDSNWFLVYAGWDFNNSGSIDIFDVSYVAKLIK